MEGIIYRLKNFFEHPNEVQRMASIYEQLFKSAAFKDNDEIYKLMTENRINCNDYGCRDDYDNTLLHIAAKVDNHDLMLSLINNGADKKIKNIFNETCIDIALRYHSRNCLRILLNRCSDNDLIERIEFLEKNNNNLQLKAEADKKRMEAIKESETVCRKKLKRKRKEIDDMDREFKKVKKDNKILQTTVHSLRNAYKINKLNNPNRSNNLYH